MHNEKKTNSNEYPVLKIMNESEDPLGAGAVGEKLAEQQIFISEAGIGRLLRALRQEGLLDRVGFQGHVISESGKERLKKLESNLNVREALKLMLSRTGPLKDHNLIDLLIARRALEREAAYQAALTATEKEINKLGKIISSQYEEMGKNKGYADLSSSFHQEIVNISHVPILRILYDFLGLTTQLQDFFIGTFKMFNEPLNISHEKVFEAIRNRDPERAANLMEEHLTVVINNAKKLY
ncbi:MAG: FCD domain-containing protein [Synergistaceae bacterium]|nr:FCD domain-containing protein [Synergistaceae bacterium]